MIDSFRVAFFLAYRYIRRSNIWTTILIVFVMTLTFLNLVVVTGILVGLIEGASNAYGEQYSGDVLISTHPDKTYIDRSSFVIEVAKNDPRIESLSARYVDRGEVEVDFQRTINKRNVLPDLVGAEFVGIDIEEEGKVTDLEDLMIEGEFLSEGDEGFIVLGANLLDRYLPGSFGFQTLKNIEVGDKVRIRVAGAEDDFILKGVLKSKADVTDLRAYLTARELRTLIGRSDFNVDEVALRLKDPLDAESVRDSLINSGLDEYALVRTQEDVLGQFLDEIRDTFLLLGNIIGSIALVVASITVFIVIFITAITRRRYIGILRAIGISGKTIEFSYVMLSLFYALIGVAIGFALLYGFLVPYFDENPIDFPFSDGILAVTLEGTIVRSFLIVLTTIIAGYIPARLIVSKKPLDAIQGR